MKKFLLLFSAQLQTLFVFVMFILFIYFPNLNDEINLLPFQIDAISWRDAWYYIVIFVLVWIFIYLRVEISERLLKVVLLKDLIISDFVIAFFGVFFFFFPKFWLFGLLVLFFALLLVSIDVAVERFKYRANFMYVVLVLFFFVNNILLFVSWQNDYSRLEYSAMVVEECRLHENWSSRDDKWSVGKYSNSVLIKSVGQFDYPLYYDFEIDSDGLNYIMIRNQAEHFVYSYDGDVYIACVPSWRPFYRYVVNFTYLFALYLLISFVFYYVKYWRRLHKPSSFFSRLQSTLICFFIVSMLIVFVSASAMIVNRHERNACYNQQYRMQFLVKYFTPILQSCVDCEELLSSSVVKVANLLSANISMYDAEGNLFICEGEPLVVPDKISDFVNDPFYNMPATTYAKLIEENNVSVVQSYAILLDVNKMPIYVVMSSQGEFVKLNRNLALFFVLMFNLFFLTMIVTSFVSYLISRRLSAPLSLLEKNMSEIELVGDNEKIDYPLVDGDVLSKLVVQYNSMIDKLAVSVEKLTQSEREASWRQMARQMAHEIKNPLTPMQLLSQRLLLQDYDNLQEYRDVVHKSAKALLQGIESITTTTDALSNFAKKPIVPLEPINIVESVRYTVDLFRNNEEDVNINFSTTLDSAMVMVDKEMIGHVFNNLLKNAIQAIPDDRKGDILVKIYHNVTDVMVSVTDNGIGIPDKNRDKLFNVNFTTKTKGMGLGLLVVKNVVDQAKGKIEFYSQVDNGSTFIVSFPMQDGI